MARLENDIQREGTDTERERQRGLGAVPREDISVTWGWGGESGSKENSQEITIV